MILKRFLNDERGSAMTEFVIGLPIFLLIFSGMGGLYTVSQGALVALASANTQVWTNAQQANSFVGMSPLTGTLSNISGGGTEAALANGAGIGGMYFDSWTKLLVTKVVPGAPGTDPVNDIKKIHKKFRKKSPATILLNDKLSWNKPANGGVLGWVSTAVSALGAGPAIGAGIRYGQIEGNATSSIATTFGTYAIDSGTISLPRNTVATYRLIPVGMIRLEHSKYKVTHKSILNFTFLFSADLGGPPDWGADGTTTGDAHPEPAPGTATDEPQVPSLDSACALLGIC